MIELLLSTVAQGLQWSVLALGVFLTFRVLDIADLSVEGSFPLGAAVAASSIASGLGLYRSGLLGRSRDRLFNHQTPYSRALSRHFDHDWALLHQPARDG